MISGADGEIDLSLEKAKSIALENNPDIKIQKKNLEISTADIIKEKGIYDPLLNFGIGYSTSNIPTASTFIDSGTINEDSFDIEGGFSGRLPSGTTYEFFQFNLTRTDTNSPLESLSPNYLTSLSFSLAQDLLKDFGKDVNNTVITVAKDNKEISIYELENVVSDILLNVEKEYWQVIASIKNLELERKAYELALDLERRNKIQVEVGVLPRVSVTQAQSEVAARQVDLIGSENELSKSEDILKNRLALDLYTKLKFVDEPKISETYINEEEILKTSYDNRPELKQAQLEIKKNESLKKFFSNQRLPKLSLEGKLQLRGLGGSANPNELVFSDTASEISSQFDEASDAFSSIPQFDFPTWTI
ncbi:MAG: TolC family protein, partial [Thermodesulfobacteriota bacterium]